MRRALLVVAAGVLTAGSVGAASPEVSAATGGYSTYVACSTKTSAKPATECKLSEPKAAFFRSARHDATYKVCVKFPGRKRPLCANAQQADKGRTRVVTITTAKTGKHKVTWYVGGKKVGTWSFQVTAG